MRRFLLTLDAFDILLIEKVKLSKIQKKSTHTNKKIHRPHPHNPNDYTLA